VKVRSASQCIQHTAVADAAAAGRRLDQVAARLFPAYSRARLQEWIRSGALTLDGQPARPRDRLRGGEMLVLAAELEPVVENRPQPLPLDVLHADEHLLVINKPAGLVVHPAAGHPDGTLVNGLLYHYPELEALPRAGLVHRLDKDTTGVMVVARSLPAHHGLVAALQARRVLREYEAVTWGIMVGGGTLTTAHGRHPRDRKRMAVLQQGGREAITHYRVLQHFAHHSHVQCRLETGRTHQIRVHMAHLHHPLVGDPSYGGRRRLPPGAPPALRRAIAAFDRQALHARRLGLVHPVTGQAMEWEAARPRDLAGLLAALRGVEGVEEE